MPSVMAAYQHRHERTQRRNEQARREWRDFDKGSQHLTGIEREAVVNLLCVIGCDPYPRYVERLASEAGWRVESLSSRSGFVFRCLNPPHGGELLVELALGAARLIQVQTFEVEDTVRFVVARDSRIEFGVECILRLVLPRSKQGEMIGDLLEEYREDILPKFGRWAACSWLLRHGFSDVCAAFHFRRWALLATILGLIRRYMQH